MQTEYSYGHQLIDEDDKAAVLAVLDSDYLTSGPKVEEFEVALCDYTGARYCVAVSSGTAALHLAVLALGIGDGDSGITSPITFAATANALCYAGAKPDFADIESGTANLNPVRVTESICETTRAILPVHFAGQSCDMEKIRAIAQKHNLWVIEDAAHAIGSDYKNTKVGSCAYSDMTVFSFHPVKSITTGEGGAITTNNLDLYRKLKSFRAHGIHKDGAMNNNWLYEMRELGYNYRMNELQAALGISQLKKIDKFKQRRREIVDWYNRYLGLPHLQEKVWSKACFHLYPILIPEREKFYELARKEKLNLQVHYIPVHLQPYYRNLGYQSGDFPLAEQYYEQCISLPLHPGLNDSDLEEIRDRIHRICRQLDIEIASAI